MMKTVLVCCLLAFAAADDVNMFLKQADVDTLAASIKGKAGTTVADALKDASTKSSTDLTDLNSALTSLHTKMGTVETTQMGLIKRVDAQIMMQNYASEVRAKIDALKNKVQNALNRAPNVVNQVKDTEEELMEYGNAKIGEIADSSKKAVALSVAKLNIAGAIKTFQADVVKHTKKTYMYSGYCSYHQTRGGESEYCHNGVMINTIAPYLSREGTGRFRVKKNGYYRLVFQGISHSCNWYFTKLYVNGKRQWHGHDYNYNTWRDHTVDYVIKATTDTTFWLNIYAGCHWRWHSGNPQGSHSVYQVIYMGDF